MNVFSLLSFLSVILCVFSIISLFRNYGFSRLTVMFAVYVSCFTMWSLGYVFIYPETNKEVVWFWYRVSSIGWIPLHYVTLIFYVYLVKSTFFIKRKWIFIILAIFPVWMFYKQFTGHFFVVDFEMTPFGNFEVVDNSFNLYFYSVYFMINGFILSIVLISSIVKIKLKKLKVSLIVLAGLNFGVMFFIFILNIFLPILDIKFPSLGAILSMSVPFFTFFVVDKYEFYNLNLYHMHNFRKTKIINSLFNSELFLNSMKVGILVIDDDYTILKTNSYTESFKKNSDVEIGKTKCYEYLYGRDKKCDDCFGKFLTLETDNKINKTLMIKEEERFFDVHYFPFNNENINFKGNIILLNDITSIVKQKKLQEDTERMIRHDIKNHVYSISGFSNFFMAKEEYDYKETSEIFRVIYDQSQKITQIINNSLTMLKLELGEYKVIRENVDILGIIINTGMLLGTMIKEKNIKFIYDSIKGKITELEFKGEVFLIENMFLNLIKNAIEAAPEGSEVVIDSYIEGKFIVVTIHNKGIIPEKVRETFFMKYSTHKSGGNGLGNYTAYLIAKAHGGNIEFTTSDEHGTDVFVRVDTEFFE